jgi:hypothetical protein
MQWLLPHAGQFVVAILLLAWHQGPADLLDEPADGPLRAAVGGAAALDAAFLRPVEKVSRPRATQQQNLSETLQ